MKWNKRLALLLALCLAFSLLPALALPGLAPEAEAAYANVGDELSTLEPGDYIVRYTIGRNSIASDYDNVRIRAWAGSTLLDSASPANTLPKWEEKTVFLTVDQVPDRIEIQVRYTTDGQDWRDCSFESTFEECSDTSAWITFGDFEILLCEYTIREDVPHLIDLDGSVRKIHGRRR